MNIVMNWESFTLHTDTCTGSRKQYNEANKGCPKSYRNFPTYNDAIESLTVESKDEALDFIDGCGDYIFDYTDEEKNGLFDRCLSDLPQSATETEEVEEEDEEEWDEEEDIEGVGYYGPIEVNGRPKEWAKYFDTSFEVVDSSTSEIQFRINKAADGERPFGHVVIVMTEDANEVEFDRSNLEEPQIDKLIKAVGGEKKFFSYLGKVADKWFDIEENIFEELGYDA